MDHVIIFGHLPINEGIQPETGGFPWFARWIAITQGPAIGCSITFIDKREVTPGAGLIIETPDHNFDFLDFPGSLPFGRQKIKSIGAIKIQFAIKIAKIVNNIAKNIFINLAVHIISIKWGVWGGRSPPKTPHTNTY